MRTNTTKYKNKAQLSSNTFAIDEVSTLWVQFWQDGIHTVELVLAGSQTIIDQRGTVTRICHIVPAASANVAKVEKAINAVVAKFADKRAFDVVFSASFLASLR